MISKKHTLLQMLLVLAIIFSSCIAETKLKVCIIGAGVSGLISAKQLSENLANVELIVFERGTDIGGQWKYTDSSGLDEHGLPVHSGVYKNLRTNYPKILMTLPDYREFRGENRSYVKHENVLEYLRNYTEHFNLRQYIKLDTLVETVSRMDDKKWRVKVRNLYDDQIEVYTCDAIMLCNGHYYKSYSPIIPGLDKFTGRSIHSHSYRKPEEFANQTVAILGALYSGIDIGLEITNYAKKVYLSHRQNKIAGELPENMKQIPGIVAANGSYLILNEGSRVQADSLIICTGYDYDFPFLDETAGITITKGKYVHPLYKHSININHPTMIFIGVPHPGFPFLVSYVQVQYFVSLLQGTAKLPSREVMLKDSQLPLDTPVNKAHFIEIGILDYCNDLKKASGLEPLSESLKTAVLIYYEDLQANVLHFKENELVIYDDGRVELIKPNNTVKIEYGY